MPRYRLTIEYEGGGFVGWQRQDNGPSVQAAIENAIVRFCGEAARVVGAGRTDAGVHALAQVAHVDLARPAAPETIRDAVNFYLRPAAVAIRDATPVGDDFHARFSAVSRTYVYRLLVRPAPPALDRGRVWWLRHSLDTGAMAEAAAVLVGHHDFTSFRAVLCQARSPVKTLDELRVEASGEEVRITARARSFLHSQVRIIVGSLKQVGDRRWTAGDMAAALAARDRARTGPTAPPDGLYLAAVDYP